MKVGNIVDYQIYFPCACVRMSDSDEDFLGFLLSLLFHYVNQIRGSKKLNQQEGIIIIKPQVLEGNNNTSRIQV